MADIFLVRYTAVNAHTGTQRLAGAITEDQHARILAILEEANNPPKFTTVPIPCISMRHIRAKTRRWVEEGYGRFEDLLFQAAAADETLFLTAPNLDERHRYPEDLQAIFAFADKHATHGWVMLDVDGEVIEGMPTY